MKILLVDADRTGFPNLALMKLSAWHRKRGDRVWLNSCPDKPDRVYISCAFEKHRNRALLIARAYESQGCEVELGGYGVSTKILADEVEHIMPDYSLYGIDYSMGFTTRGCVRRCSFCHVWRKEGPLREHSPIEEFWNPRHNKLLLLDNNFLASPLWREKLEFLIARRLKVNFSQGLDIRLIDRESARLLRLVRYYDRRFKRRRLHFAWDLMETEDAVVRGIRTLREAGLKLGIKDGHLMFYVLTGYNTTFEEDLYRVKKLLELRVMPYVMIYNDRRDILVLRHFARWVNRSLYLLCPWEKYERWLKQKGQRVFTDGLTGKSTDEPTDRLTGKPTSEGVAI